MPYWCKFSYKRFPVHRCSPINWIRDLRMTYCFGESKDIKPQFYMFQFYCWLSRFVRTCYSSHIKHTVALMLLFLLKQFWHLFGRNNHNRIIFSLCWLTKSNKMYYSSPFKWPWISNFLRSDGATSQNISQLATRIGIIISSRDQEITIYPNYEKNYKLLILKRIKIAQTSVYDSRKF